MATGELKSAIWLCFIQPDSGNKIEKLLTLYIGNAKLKTVSMSFTEVEEK